MKSPYLSVLCLFVASAVSPLVAQLPSTWTEATSPTTKTFNKVHFANGTFIAAGNGDVNAGGGAVVVRSTDGITWQKVFENTASPFFAGCGVAYATGGWVVGGNWGKALTSTDGVNWTVRSSPLADPMNGVVANGASLVAACNVGNILFSSDSGATWSTRSSGTSNGLGGVAYGSGLYVVSGASGTILTSPDGSSWTARSSGTTQGIWSIAYANSMFVAVGQGGTILTSPDGTTWTARSSGVTGDLNSVTRGAGLWMVVGSGGRVLLSADGVTWTTQASGLSHNLVSVSFGAGRFVVVGESGRIHSLVPGEPRQLWASLNKGFGGPAGALGFNNGLFVAGWGDSVEGGTIATSTDGVSWTVRQTVSGAGMYSTAYGNGRYVVGSNWGKVYSSADGVTWTLGSYGDPSPLYVGFFNGKFIGTAGDGTTRYTSTDGITWTRVATGSQFGGSFANNGSTLVSAGAGTLQWSSDGLVWNNPTTALPQVWYMVAYGAGLFVAIDQSGHIYTSPDGKVWTSRVSPINAGLSLAYGGGRFVVFGSGGVTAESRDGVSWFAGNSNVSLDLTRAAYGNSRFVGVASGGRLLVSNLETQTDLNFGLVARYAFDGDARDSGPDGLHLNAGAAVSEFVADRAGNPRGAVRFISRNANDLFFTGTGPALANQSSSVAFWVRKEFTGEGTWVFGLGSGGSSGKTMHVALDYSGSPIRYSFYYDDFNTPSSVASNAWAHVACTFDAATRERRIYLNGVLQGSNTAAYGFSGDTALVFQLPGISLDDFRFYNRVLSANEVTTLAAPAGSPPVVSSQPQSQTVAPGSAVTLSVIASGSPNPTYQWRKNGLAIAGATDSTLSLPTHSGAAGFDVIISNSFGSITSRKSWVTAMTWTSVTVSGALRDSAFNDAVGIAVGDSGRILRSTDGGFTWTAVSSGVTDNFQAVKHAGAGVFYACGWLWGAHGVVLKSADNGLTWTQVLGLSGTGQELFGLHAPTPKIVYVAGTNQIRKSTDGGSTWATTTFPNGYEYNVERLGSRLVAIANAGTNSFRYSTDEGATWTLATTQVPTVLDAAKLGDSLFVAGDAGAIYRTENGITYTNVGASSGPALRSLVCLADQLYAVDTGKLYTVDPTGATRLVKDSGSTVNAVAASGSRLFVLGNNVILVGTPAVADPAVPVEGLLAHFAFDGSAADSSPYARSASPVSVTYGPDRAGRVGSAAVFNGSSSLVTVPSAAELSFTGDFTLSLWANLGTPVPQMLLAKHKAYGADPGFIFVRRDYGYDFEPPYSTASPELTTAAGAGKWSHLVFTFSPASQEYAFYVDGAMQKGGWNGGTVLTADSTPLYLGAEPHANGSIQNYMQGSLDELRIYGRALSHSEIRGLYAAEAAASMTVSSPMVNEASPYAVFTVTGNAGQTVSLALANGTATGGGTDYGSATATINLQYSLDNGANWLNYSTTGAFALPAGGSVLVRTPVVNDAVSDNNETFTLTATPASGQPATGTCTIKDDGTGDIYKGDGTKDTAAPKDDDRGLTVAGTTVNEASPYAVFTVIGSAGQTVSLALANGTATGGGADYGSATPTTNLQYSLDNGANWLNYSTTGAFALPAGGSVLVRTPIVNDTTPDNGETFTLTATNTGVTGATGTGTIKDDGTGSIFNPDGSNNTTAPKDDDRPSAMPVAPAFTTQPQSQTASASGGTVSFSVAVSGTPAPALQWYFNGAPIAGATGTTLTLTNVQASAAGNYWVVATNGAGSVKSSLAAFSLTQPGNSGTQALVGSGYTAGQTLTVTNTLNYTGTASALSWAVLLPQGWSYASSGGSAGEQGPAVGTTDVLEWAWTSVPPSPVTFTYSLNIPAGTSGPQEIVALGGVRNGASLQFLAQPDPLPVPQVTTHSADTDRNFRIALLELTRVIELYNTRNGTTRTGCYAVATIATEDGFAPDSARASSAVVTLARYHSADSNRDGKISLLELTRVIELYNYRSGTTRTGQYKVQPGTEDGFAPGPGTTVVNIQMVIDHDSALVIAPTGLYWRHYGYAKPGFYGNSYEIPGPFLIGTQTWTPTWDTPGSRDSGVSSVFALNTAGFSGWSLSQSYGGAFNSYPQDSGATVLAQSLSLNRGTVTSTTVDGFPAIRFQDFFSGQNVYSVDLKFER